MNEERPHRLVLQACVVIAPGDVTRCGCDLLPDVEQAPTSGRVRMKLGYVCGNDAGNGGFDAKNDYCNIDRRGNADRHNK
jgi:hypothetical protein